MTINATAVRKLLKSGDLIALFVRELGWDKYSTPMNVLVDGVDWPLLPLAQKRGMAVFRVDTPKGSAPPDRDIRMKIERHVAKAIREHLLIFVDAESGDQRWQWVRREPSKPLACREQLFRPSQSGEALIQRLDAISFSLGEEESLTLLGVAQGVKAAFDIEKVTKRFFDRFQKEHAAFLKFIIGITDGSDREWYASVMLNRLMFVYFIQRKGFLNGETDYLRTRLQTTRVQHGKDKFYSFYRYFLLKLFHEGLGGKERTAALDRLLGKIPYLNGGLFDVHELERPDRYGKAIEIPDEAFERVFAYFDQYHWHLDERPLKADNEINPDVLGYIFEKYINQKQMGAYYTKEDITEYISKNTLVPFLLSSMQANCKIAFSNVGAPTVWDLLVQDPDRYLQPSLAHGTTAALPDFVATGMTPPTLEDPVKAGRPRTLELRKRWNAPAPATHGLPTETWRQVVARRHQHARVKGVLSSGKVRTINHLVSLNVDSLQFAQDTIDSSAGPELLRAAWKALTSVTVLDPTCGSGAFLFAALNVLEPLYEACLERMQVFIEEPTLSGVRGPGASVHDFETILANVKAHPNRRYFILKSIILNNLFGVDIMEEAVEICKLRLFLKLVAQVAPDSAQPNFGVEPLPDIDFNIRAGNSLVGYSRLSQQEAGLDLDGRQARLRATAGALQATFNEFRSDQIGAVEHQPPSRKSELIERLDALSEELDEKLAAEYGVQVTKPKDLAAWKKTHQPFHWAVEFYGTMAAGGFDVVIGNPPFVELNKVEYSVRHFITDGCGDLYALCMERSRELLKPSGRFGMIVPISVVSADGFSSLRRLLLSRRTVNWTMNFAERPSKLFEGVDKRLSIWLSSDAEEGEPRLFVSAYRRWFAEERPTLFGTSCFLEVPPSGSHVGDALPKIGSPVEGAILAKLAQQKPLGTYFTSSNPHVIYYTRKLRYFVQFFDFIPLMKDGRGRTREPSELKELFFDDQRAKAIASALLNSSLFFWFFNAFSDVRNVNRREIEAVRCSLDIVQDDVAATLSELVVALMKDFRKNARMMTVTYKQHGTMQIQSFQPRASKPIIDDIDRALARHYGLTEAQLDFILNYDVKYRLGADEESPN